jgi:hypothetical protein
MSVSISARFSASGTVRTVSDNDRMVRKSPLRFASNVSGASGVGAVPLRQSLHCAP